MRARRLPSSAATVLAATTLAATFLAAAVIVGIAAPASAQDASTDRGSIVGSDYAVDPMYVPSTEQTTVELRIGSYRPDLGTTFSNSFGGDLGPRIGAEIDFHIWRIPFIGPIAIGGSFGWTEWTGAATADTAAGTNVGQTGLSLLDMSVLAVLRADGMARHLGVPIVLSGKFGLDVGYFQTGSGGVTQAEGWAVGMRWAAQIALELDILETRAARRLDEEWGINHSELFFELYGSDLGAYSDRQVNLGAALAWTVGLGFTF
jgi:hypothetical protein